MKKLHAQVFWSITNSKILQNFTKFKVKYFKKRRELYPNDNL